MKPLIKTSSSRSQGGLGELVLLRKEFSSKTNEIKNYIDDFVNQFIIFLKGGFVEIKPLSIALLHKINEIPEVFNILKGIEDEYETNLSNISNYFNEDSKYLKDVLTTVVRHGYYEDEKVIEIKSGVDFSEILQKRDMISVVIGEPKWHAQLPFSFFPIFTHSIDVNYHFTFFGNTYVRVNSKETAYKLVINFSDGMTKLRDDFIKKSSLYKHSYNLLFNTKDKPFKGRSFSIKESSDVENLKLFLRKLLYTAFYLDKHYQILEYGINN